MDYEVGDGVSLITKTFNNDATVNWKSVPEKDEFDGEIKVNAENGVATGFNALTKSGVQSETDKEKHQITWTINVDLRGQNPEGLIVYDLFVHDSKTDDELITSAAYWPAGLEIGNNQVRRNNGQKFVAGSESVTEPPESSGQPTVTIIDLKNGNTVIATLVKISELTNGKNEVTFKSQVIAPEDLTGNASKRIYNYTSLYKGGAFRSSTSANVSYNNRVLAKEMLKRDEVGKDYDSINANNKTTTAGEGFHYGYKEVIFRLNVNAAGIDFTQLETNNKGTGFNDITVTDTLPAGWEFTAFSNGAKYLLYEATGPSTNGSLTAKTEGNPLSSPDDFSASFSPAETDPQTAAFTFTALEKPYVILVKARPTDDTFAGYLTGADTRDETNNLKIKSDKLGLDKDSTQKVTVDSKLIKKSIDLENLDDGILIWSVDYTPFDLDTVGSGLRDTLPQGIDLRTDADGNLIWGEEPNLNINVYKLDLQPGGKYTEGDALSLDDLKESVTYSSTDRELLFNFPDREQAYRFTYVTDITGMPGKIENAVELIDVEGNGTKTKDDYVITDEDGWATAKRSGSLVVLKEDTSGVKLSGVTFTLYFMIDDGDKGLEKGVRTTDDAGQIAFFGLAPGRYILEETAPDGYIDLGFTYTVSISDDYKTTVNGLAGIDKDNPFVIVNFSDDEEIGSLKIRKEVAGDGADLEMTFNFTVTLEGTTGQSFKYFGHGLPDGEIKSGDPIALAGGQSITIVGLPAGTKYTVAEDDYKTAGYAVNNTSVDGEISENVTDEALFTNTRTVGSLTIEKTIAGMDPIDAEAAFRFVVNLTGVEDKKYPYTGEGVDDGEIASGDAIYLSHGQSITINELPAGAGYEVKEDDYKKYGYQSSEPEMSGVIETGVFSLAAFTNTRTVGSLTVQKTVAGNSGDLDEDFSFTLILGEEGDLMPDIAYPYIGDGVADGTIKNGETFTLKHNQSITINELPAGIKYSIVESDAGYQVIADGDQGTIALNKTLIANFLNVLNEEAEDSGNLTISKTVTGDGADKDKQFFFRVLLEGTEGQTFDYSGIGVADGTIASGDVIKLAHGQSITISGLPAETSYTVIEADYSGEGYEVTSSGDVGEIEAGGTAISKFINNNDDTVLGDEAIRGSLLVEKAVAGNAGEKDRPFEFTVELKDVEPGTLYPYAGHGVADGMVGNDETIFLAHGQGITIYGLPIGASYVVREKDYSADGYVVTMSGASGTFVDQQTLTASFVNTRNIVGPLTIKKVVDGDLGDRTKEFTFIVELDSEDTFVYKGSKSGTIKNGQSIKLKNGESVTIEGIPTGTAYLVKEVEANQDGYVTSATNNAGVIDVAGKTATFFNSKQSVPVEEGGIVKTGETDNTLLTAVLVLTVLGFLIGLRTLVDRKRKKHNN